MADSLLSDQLYELIFLVFLQIGAGGVEEFAGILDDYKALIHVNYDDEVIIVPRDAAYAILAASWVAHIGSHRAAQPKEGTPAEKQG